MFSNDWFSGRMATKNPPADAVLDCSVPGQAADEAVDYWVNRLGFDGPSWLIREHLSGYGAWEPSDLCDHQQNLRRLLWVWCFDIVEEIGDRSSINDETVGQVCPLYLMR